MAQFKHGSNDVTIGKTSKDVGNVNDGVKHRQSNYHTNGTKPKKKRLHPLKMPLRTDPVTNRIICRFHNYDARSGCKKYNDLNNSNPNNPKANAYCEFDHDTCHICLEKGHLAHGCDHIDNPLSETWNVFCCLTLENTRPDDYPSHKTVLGDVILWIGDVATVTIPASKPNDPAATETSITISPPNIEGFKLGEDDLLLRCRKQKRIEAAYMLQLQNGAVVVDVGAHLGDTVLTLALHARAHDRCDLRFVALEPCAEKCTFLRSVVAANKLRGTVEVVCAAVGDVIGTVRPAANAKDRARREGSLRYESHSEADGNNDAESTPMVTLDSMFDRLSPLGMLHIDVEGWESNVLRGAKKLLTGVPETDCCRDNNHDDDDDAFPCCFVVAEAWTEKECLRRGVTGNSEEKIVDVMERELTEEKDDLDFKFKRIDDIVDIERNIVYVRKTKRSKPKVQKL